MDETHYLFGRCCCEAGVELLRAVAPSMGVGPASTASPAHRLQPCAGGQQRQRYLRCHRKRLRSDLPARSPDRTGGSARGRATSWAGRADRRAVGAAAAAPRTACRRAAEGQLVGPRLDFVDPQQRGRLALGRPDMLGPGTPSVTGRSAGSTSGAGRQARCAVEVALALLQRARQLFIVARRRTPPRRCWLGCSYRLMVVAAARSGPGDHHHPVGPAPSPRPDRRPGHDRVLQRRVQPLDRYALIAASRSGWRAARRTGTRRACAPWPRRIIRALLDPPPPRSCLGRWLNRL